MKNTASYIACCLMLVCLSIASSLFAQGKQQYAITGTIVLEDKSPVPYASVAVYRQSDSVAVGGMITADDGKFSISVKAGNYYLHIIYISYETRILNNISVGNQEVNLGAIQIKPSSVVLKEVEVVAEKNKMELKLDKRVFNVGKDVSNVGATASEVLDNVPSVTVDVEGNVNLRGSQNVRILIDGKPSSLVGLSGANGLRQLQGNMIERIEVITNPSARYDSQGEVGIINIILKKEKREGLNGSVEASGGYPANHNLSLNFNFRKKWINLFGSYGGRYRQTPGRGSSYQEFTGDSLYSYERTRTHTRGGFSHNGRFGADIYINKYNTITVSGLYKGSDGNNTAQLVYKDFNSSGDVTQIVTRDQDEKETQRNLEGSFTYTKKFKKKDREWNTNFKYMDSDDLEKADINQQYDNGDAATIQQSSNTENQTNYLIQSDYIHPFAKHGKFETGVKATLREIDNDYTVMQQDSLGLWYILTNYDNHFVYNEGIYAAYAMLGNKTGKLSYQAGLRAEYSDIRTELIKTNEVNPRSYLNFFPSAHLSYELPKSNTFQLSYSRRLSRSGFRSLLPFSSFSDSRNLYSGNPNLNPEYTHSFEISNLKYFEKGSILASIYYRHRTGVIQRITRVDSTGYTRRLPVNLATQDAFGVELNGTYDIKPWWSADANFNFYRAITEGSYNGEDLGSDTYTWTSRVTTKLTILKQYNFQAAMNYRAPRKTTQGKTLGRYNLDLGLTRDVLKGNGTITFSVKDLFNSRKWRSVIEGENYYSTSVFQWRVRQFMLTFNYRINQKKSRGKGKQEYGGDDDY